MPVLERLYLEGLSARQAGKEQLVAEASTAICAYNQKRIFVRDQDLCADLIGKISLIDFIYLLCLGVRPTGAQRAVVEAAIIALAEHGLSPSVIAARLTYMGAPESLQGAVAAGILGVGDQFVGTVEKVAPLLVEMTGHPEGLDVAARAIVQRCKTQGALIPGFGQPHHKPDDPRSPALFATAERVGASGRFVEALQTLGRHVDDSMGRHMTINAPGAVSALFLEIGIPMQLMRGLVVIGRCIGLVAHLHEEHVQSAGRTLWKAAADAVRYDGLAPIR
jgi:citrate synthase